MQARAQGGGGVEKGGGGGAVGGSERVCGCVLLATPAPPTRPPSPPHTHPPTHPPSLVHDRNACRMCSATWSPRTETSSPRTSPSCAMTLGQKREKDLGRTGWRGGAPALPPPLLPPRCVVGHCPPRPPPTHPTLPTPLLHRCGPPLLPPPPPSPHCRAPTAPLARAQPPPPAPPPFPSLDGPPRPPAPRTHIPLLSFFGGRPGNSATRTEQAARAGRRGQVVTDVPACAQYAHLHARGGITPASPRHRAAACCCCCCWWWWVAPPRSGAVIQPWAARKSCSRCMRWLSTWKGRAWGHARTQGWVGGACGAGGGGGWRWGRG